MMQVYGLFYQEIDWTLVCLFKNRPTIEDLRNVRKAEFFEPDDDEYMTEVLNNEDSEYRVWSVHVTQNGEV
jgi:hypothetical protein